MVERSFVAFGTIVTVQICTDATERANTAAGKLEALYRVLERDWRAFGPGELGQANEQLARAEPVQLSPALAALVRQAFALHGKSGGLFEPRVGELVRLWGFQDLAGGLPSAPPPEESLAQARRDLAAAALPVLEGDVLRPTAALRLELAGIAKGAALAAGAKTLESAGIRHALIAIGGDIIAIGSRGDRAWVAGLRDPRGPGVLGRVALRPGEAALSSGDYERHYDTAAGRMHHILDPRSGRPTRGVAGVTVLSLDPAAGNAAAVTLMVGGPGAFESLTTALGMEFAMLVTADGERLLTAGMRARLGQT